MKKLYLLIPLILFLSSCGRKQKNIFSFPQGPPPKKINKLSLPCVRQVNVLKTSQGNKISWNPIEDNKDFIGYNVYRLVRASIIPKKPINKFLIKDVEFVDIYVIEKDFPGREYPCCYVVRAAFKIDNKVVEGLTSQIVCEK